MECGLDGLLQTGRHEKSVQMAEMVFENSLLIPVLNQLIPSWGWLSSICFLMTRSREPAQLVEDLVSSMRTGKTQKKTLGINLSQKHLVTHSRKHKNWRFIWAGCLWIFSIILSLKLIREHESPQTHKQRNLRAFWQTSLFCCQRSEAAWLQVKHSRTPCPT